MSTHTGVYRLACNVCSQGFNEKIRLDKHSSQNLLRAETSTQTLTYVASIPFFFVTCCRIKSNMFIGGLLMLELV